MTTISATVVADSVSGEGIRLTTLQLRYPRFIHAEVMTHRVFSRNARSSRAVPVETMLREIEQDPVVPLFWGANQKGMQADQECENYPRVYHTNIGMRGATRENTWGMARDQALKFATAFANAGYHKQVVNRILEPFMHIDVLVTATDWSNFLSLRDHAAAEPHIRLLATKVRRAMAEWTPQQLKPGQWHLPYVTYGYPKDDANDDLGAILAYCNRPDGLGPNEFQTVARKVSVARCARISYKPFDGDGSIDSEVRRHDELVGAVPMHASPAEHQAMPDSVRYVPAHGTGTRSCRPDWNNAHEHGNFRGWRQYRKMLPGESVQE